ncbi:MAG: neuraminidase-like domain-containing protein [Ktedonobacteraceae bacterium]
MLNTNTFRLNGAQLDKTVIDNLTVGTDSVTHIKDTLNMALKTTLSSALTENGYTILAGLIQNMDPVDITANKDVPLRTFIMNQVQSKIQNDVVLKTAVDEAVSKLSTTTTVGDLLSLNMPLKDNPLFKDDAQKAALSSLLATSPALTDLKLQATFINLYVQHQGTIQDFWSSLSEQPEFKAPGIVEQLQFTLQLGLLTQNNVPLVAAVQEAHQQGTITSIRDLTRLSENDWTLLINNPLYNISVPASIPGTTHDEQVANYVQSMMDLLCREFPTAFVAKAVAQQPEIHANLVKTVLAQNPGINPGAPLPDTLKLASINADDQAKAKASMEVLRQEITMFPAFDHQKVLTTPAPAASSDSPTMHEMVAAPSTVQNPVRTALGQFLANAPDFDFHTTHVDTFLAEHGETALKDIDPQLKTALPSQLKAMQRIFQVTPDPAAMNVLMGAGLDSAHAIASIPQPTFTEQFQTSLGGETQAQQVHDKAKQINALATTTFVNLHQQLNDVSPRAVGGVDQATIDAIKSIPNWSDLFGRLDLCDCDKCRSVYSPAAYFVDLLQFLNPKVPPKDPNDPTKDGKRPVDVLFERRPDLQYIQLTCENTNTTLPYVDLVNEILETYVALDGTNVDFSNQAAIGKQLVKNTDSAVTADELSATPAYSNNAAYDKLNGPLAIYPLTLPYNRPLEVARTYLQQLGSNRYEVMKTFQKASSPPDIAIACEYLTITPQEHQILTGKDFKGVATPPRAIYEFYGYAEQDFYPAPLQLGSNGLGVKALQLKLNTGGANPALIANGNFDTLTQAAVKAFQQSHSLTANGTVDSATWAVLKTIQPDSWRVFLASVPELLKQTGIQYADLLEFLKTRFFNPTQALSLDTLAGADPCDLNNVSIKNLDNASLNKLHRFIRLWQKTGWTVRDLDRVLFALGATDIDDPLLQKLALVKQLQTELNVPLIPLLSLWANIDADGGILYDKLYKVPGRSEDCLYNKLFQNRAIHNPMDADFQDFKLVSTQGKWELDIVTKTPPDPNAKISTHLSTILAVLRITAADLTTLTTTKVTDDTLNLSNLSMLYRFALLVRALKAFIKDFTLKDLFTLMALTGKNPFAPGDPSSTRTFVDIVNKVSQSGFSITQLNYLYRHLYEPNGGIALLQGNVNLLITGLQDGLKKIASDTVVMLDPTGDLLRRKLSIILDSTLVGQAMTLIDGSAVYTTMLANNPNVTFPDAVKAKISYDTANHKLRYIGNMTQADETLLLGLSANANYKTAISDLFQQPRTFITKNMAAFLNPNDAISHLVENVPFTQGGQSPAVEEKYAYVLTSLMSYLRISLSQNLIKQTLSDALKLDTAMVDLLLGSLLQTGTPLILKSRTNPSQYAMADFLALLDGGISGTYFANKSLDPAVGPWITRIDPTISFNWGTGSPDPAISSNTFSARWTGKILTQYSETYTFTTHTNNGVRLWVDNRLLIDDWKDQPAIDHSATLELKAGQLYDVKMEYYNDSSGAVAELRWSSPSTTTMTIPQSQLYPSSAFAMYSLLHKVALLVNTFKMTVQEVKYLSDPAHSGDFAQFDLNTLPLNRSDQTDNGVVARFNQWVQLNDLFALRNSLPQSEVGLIDVFGVASSSKDVTKLSAATINTVIAATSWDAKELAILTGPTRFNLRDTDFKNAAKMLVLQACFSLSTHLATSVASLFNWAANEPDAVQAQAIKDSVKAMYDNQQWLTIAKSLNDGLRESQKDALIAYILQMLKRTPALKATNVTTSSQLYEYFLIDVDMSSCLLTSRIVQANATIQLFVQRCLMNLEPDVLPNAIVADEWKWMKRYRMWEANRQVFLYPENWIEPALRDDKTSFFKELETELLQSDITLDTAESAFLNYLEKLDQVARLEICGMYWHQEPVVNMDWRNVVTAKTNVLHVFARTFAIPHIYYYRQLLVNTMTWTPWEKVNVDIEGDHLIPVVYNRRLYVFWPSFTEKPDTTKSQIPKDANSPQEPQKKLEIKLAWSECKQNKWSAKQVSLDSEALLLGSLAFGQSFITFRALIEDQQLKIRVYYDTYKEGSGVITLGVFVFKESRGRIAIDTNPTVFSVLAHLDEGFYRFMTLQEPPGSGASAQLNLVYGYFGNKPNPTSTEVQQSSHLLTLQRTPSRYDLLYPHQFYQFVLQAPFFYQDDERTYFVSPEDLLIGIRSFQPNSIIPPLNRATVASAVTNNGSNAGNPPIFDRAALTTANERAVAVRTPAVLATPSTPVGVTAAAQPITNEPNRTMTQPRVVSGSVVSAGGAGNALPDTVRKDLPIRLFGGPGFLPSTRFFSFYHPHVGDFIKLLNQGGIPSLLTPDTQKLIDGKGITTFETEYSPNTQLQIGQNFEYVDKPYPLEDVDFDFGGAYSLYNWEMFFHAPMLIATRLSKNQRFAEAQQWFHYIFNPTDSSTDSVPQRYWKVKPFFENKESKRLQALLELLDAPADDPGRQKLEKQVQQWRDNPFNPHVIARMRLIAYQKNVVMKYIDNLIAWGDQLFQQDTMESINEATGLYILAYEILGPRPERIPMQGTIQPKTYYDLTHDPSTNPPGGSIFDSFSNAVVSIENIIQGSAKQPAPGSNGTGAAAASSSTLGSTFYFCIPQNDKLLSYWDTVADRLFKIRHCMNIEGVVRQLPLFAPPIDVSLLVQAAAMGIDLSSALNDINAATPHYRFTYMLQKALELCADLKALGGALLSALEKKDAEGLALLRSTQEIALLSAVEEVKKQQIEEAKQARAALEKTKLLVEARRDFYQNIVRISDKEQFYMDGLGQAHHYNEIAQGLSAGVSVAHLIPDFDVGIAGWASTPTVKFIFGGTNLGNSLQAAAGVLSMIAAQYTHDATMASITGGYDRRWEDWKLQEDLANKELDQIDRQIAAADIRKTIAQKELQNHELQIEHAKAVDEYMRNKYTNQELYDWMISQVSAIYFQCYQMAYDLAKRAEKAFRFERGLTTSNYITFGYWDSLKKGLLSGERLYLDLKRLEMAYIDQNKREYEITKHISLVLLDPLALITLKEIGSCFIDVPEMFFDMDYPGQYMRRIKNATLTIPCVAGPYTSINCTLTLLSNKVRIDSNAQGQYAEQDSDKRFVYSFGAIESIATSTAQNDIGMFEVNLRDERYLPFEGSGLISKWRIDMPRDCNAFDFETISDVILKISYTAREGGAALQKVARAARDAALHNTQTQQSRLFSARHEFPGDWYRFLHPADTAPSQALALALAMERFPFLFRGLQLNIQAMKLFLKLKDGFAYVDGKALAFTFGKDGNPSISSTFKLGGSPISTLAYAEALQGSVGSIGKWILTVLGSDAAKLDPTLQRTVTVNGQNFVHLNPDAIEDVWIICQYSLK